MAHAELSLLEQLSINSSPYADPLTRLDWDGLDLDRPDGDHQLWRVRTGAPGGSAAAVFRAGTTARCGADTGGRR